MKKCKITILKTTFDAELAKEYGPEGLTPCPMMKERQVFYADYAKPEGFVMKHGKQFINMFLHWHIVQEMMSFIMATGFGNQELLSVVVMMV